MEIISLINPETAAGKTKDLFDGVLRRIGRVPKMIRLLANSPAAAEAYIQFNVNLSRAELTKRTRSLVAVAVAEANNCAYSAMIARGQAKEAGAADEDIALARRAEATDHKTATGLQFAVEVVAMRGMVGTSRVLQLRSAGYNDAEIVELVATVVLSLYRNYFNLVAGTEIDTPGNAALG